MKNTETLNENEVRRFIDIVGNVRARMELSGNKTGVELADRDLADLRKSLTKLIR